jgi:hypothetical protein
MTDFDELVSLKVNDIRELSDAYFDLLKIPDNIHTAKAEQWLLGEIQRVSSHLAAMIDNQGNSELIDH